MSTTKTTTCHFTVDPDGITNLVRDLWRERNYAKALNILMDGFPLSLDDAFAVLSGKKRLVSDDGTTFELGDDKPVHYEGNVTPPSIDALIKRLGYLEKMEPAYAEERHQRLNPVADLDDPYEEPKDAVTKAADAFRNLASKFEEKTEQVLPQPLKEMEGIDKALEILSRKELEHGLDETAKQNKEWLLARKMEAIRTRDPLEYLKEQDAMWDRPCPERDSKLEGGDGWILPNGHFYACGHMEHIWLATVLLEKQGYSEVVTGNAERTAEKLGWCKISHGEDRQLYIHNDKKNTQKQRDTLFDWCEKHGVDYNKYVDEK